MRPQPDPDRTFEAAARPLLRTLVSGDTHRVYVVHPGALAASVWNDFAARLPGAAGCALLDVGIIPEFFAAALDPTAPVVPVEALAARCLDDMEAVHPEGVPFMLVGWSFGGVVAYEMAARLDAAGRGDLLTDLVLLDSIAPVPEFKRGDDLLEPAMLLSWFAMYLGAKRGRAFPFTPGPVATEDEGLSLLLDAAVAQGVLQPGTEFAGLRKLYQAYFGGLSRNNRCVAPYQPEPTDRTVTLVKAERSLLPDSPELGWSRLATRRLRLLTAPGDHYTMLTQPQALTLLRGLLTPPVAV